MENSYFKKITTIIVFAVLLVLSFFLLRPILLSIIFGIILAFAFSPVYDWLYKKTKSKNFSAALICIFLLLLIILPIGFLTPLFIDQSIKLYIASQQMDFITPLKNIFPSLFTSTEFSSEISSILHSFVTKITNSLMNSFSEIILKFPSIFLQLILVFFTLFFGIRDKKELLSYIKSLMPFPKDIEDKLLKSSHDITFSVLYGQIVIGFIQGMILGLGFFIFGVPNALLLTFFAILAGIFPIVGPALIGIPVMIYLLVGGNTLSFVGVLIFTFISSFTDNFLRPILVSKRARLHPAIALIGMIGGFFLFGVLGFILGPLILAYLIILLELYRNKKAPGLLLQEGSKTNKS